jgi:hypothetical protein
LKVFTVDATPWGGTKFSGYECVLCVCSTKHGDDSHHCGCYGIASARRGSSALWQGVWYPHGAHQRTASGPGEHAHLQCMIEGMHIECTHSPMHAIAMHGPSGAPCTVHRALVVNSPSRSDWLAHSGLPRGCASPSADTRACVPFAGVRMGTTSVLSPGRAWSCGWRIYACGKGDGGT